MSEASRLARSTREDRVLAGIVAHRPFRQMLAHQGIDPAHGWRGCEGMIFHALRTCSNCLTPDTCRSWLVEGHPSGTYPRLCPNATIFEACRITLDPPGRRSTPGRPTVRPRRNGLASESSAIRSSNGLPRPPGTAAPSSAAVSKRSYRRARRAHRPIPVASRRPTAIVQGDGACRTLSRLRERAG